MLEKMFKVIHNLNKDLKELEKEIFDTPNTDQAKTILIKKRNIVLLKHIFQPQVVLLRQLENAINNFFQ
jgi:Mg2+ and Co2+ transporter CorA